MISAILAYIFYLYCGIRVALSDAVTNISRLIFNKPKITKILDDLLKNTPVRKNQTAIITGSNTGIGLQTGYFLATKGFHIIIACRGDKNGKTAVEYIKSECSKIGIEANVEFNRLDLSSLQSIKDFSKEIKKKCSSISLLVNNAGVMFTPYTLTADGFEMHYGVNFLGHFCLTMELLDLLIKERSRVLNLTSETYLWGKVDVSHLKGNNFNRWWNYCNSKLAVMYFTRALHQRLRSRGIDHVDVIAVNPGSVSTEITRSSSPLIVYLYNTFWLKAILGLRTPREGAASTVYSALSEETSKHSGGFIHYTCEYQIIDPNIFNQRVEEELWEASEAICGKTLDSILK